MPIRRLPEHLINLIAAGEVVERPADVLKELVENSIDAGARRIRVGVPGGLLEEIRVSDDGCGMSREDAVLAVQRHTTSKIRGPDDLRAIRTLGFRGEALASIAAVSRITIITRRREDEVGTRVEVEGGRILSTSPTASPPGTTVVVRDLFFNVPVRRRFLGPERREYAVFLEVFSRMALSRPEIYFALERRGRVQLALPPSDPMTRASRILGLDPGDLILHRSDGDPKLLAILSRPGISFQRNRIYTFVNGRFVKNELLKKAVLGAYGTTIPKGEWPATVLYLEIDPSLVDVNVHPKKYEIKFSDPEGVSAAVVSSLRKALGIEESLEIPDEMLLREEAPRVGKYRILGQALKTYIILEDEDGIVLVDQHAAHERIRFEALLNRVRRREGHSVELLEPTVVEIPPDLIPLVGDPIVRKVGFEVEEFGPDRVLVRRAPYLLSGKDVGEALRDVLEALAEGRGARASDLLVEAVKLTACRGAIKAGDELTPGKMVELVRDLLSCEQPMTCPHGRPTMIRIPRSRLETLFGRH